MDLEKLFKRLEEKIVEGVALLPKTTIGEPEYRTLLEDIVETISVLKEFSNEEEEAPKVKEIQIGDNYMSLDGSSDDRKVVFFGSDGCSFCNLAKPVYLPALKDAGVPVEYISLDEQEGNEFSQALGVQGIPAFLMVKNGRVAHKFVGYDTKLSDEVNVENLLKNVKRFL
jgi:thiol-disulfide isomerase/thioredoxin